MRSIWIWRQFPSHKGSVTWFLSLTPPKSTPTPSFYVTWKVWLIFIHLHLLYLSFHLLLCSTKNYSNVITKRDIQWCLVGLDLLCVGLELKLELVFGLGLGILLSLAWASAIRLSLLESVLRLDALECCSVETEGTLPIDCTPTIKSVHDL